MEKLKQALKKAREQLEYGYWFDGGYEDMAECVRLLEEGIAEQEEAEKRRATFTLSLPLPGAASIQQGTYIQTFYNEGEV